MERTSPYVVGVEKLGLTAPFNIDEVPNVIRGDYVNVSATFDVTRSPLDNTAERNGHLGKYLRRARAGVGTGSGHHVGCPLHAGANDAPERTAGGKDW